MLCSIIFVVKFETMKHVVNVSAVKKRMRKKPIGQRLHHFFIGVPGQLSTEELNELESVLNKEHKKLIEFIDKAKTA